MSRRVAEGGAKGTGWGHSQSPGALIGCALPRLEEGCVLSEASKGRWAEQRREGESAGWAISPSFSSPWG